MPESLINKGLLRFGTGSIPVDRTKQTSTLHGCFFVWYDTGISTGIEGGAILREQNVLPYDT